MEREKDTYRYKVVRHSDNVVIEKNITYDINRRTCEIMARFSGVQLIQIGKKMEHSKALLWLNNHHKKIRKKVAPEVEVASIPTKNYKEVIEIRVPTRFSWNEDGSFDGIEFGEFETTLLPWQEDMMNRCLDVIKSALEEKDDE